MHMHSFNHTTTSNEALRLFNELRDGTANPHRAGLLAPWSDGSRSIATQLFYTQPRVSGWDDENNIRTADIVKLQTMYPLTEEGIAFAALLAQAGLPTKEIGRFRIPEILSLARKLSVDEVPQLAVNVFGVGRTLFPNAMDINLVGGGRPVLQSEIDLRGDNSNDSFAHALEAVALQSPETQGKDVFKMFSWLGERFIPGLLTPTTAKGHRKLNTEEDFRHWIEGIIHYHEITQLPHHKRTAAIGQIVIKSGRHVAMGTDAG